MGRLSTRVLERSPKGAQRFNGTYEEFLAAQGADYLRGARGSGQVDAARAVEPRGAAVDHMARPSPRREDHEVVVALGVNCYDGACTYAVVDEAHGLAYTPLAQALG
ncbi:MAG: hypothetical protein R3A48_24615 [Polyangiales bacterium]